MGKYPHPHNKEDHHKDTHNKVGLHCHLHQGARGHHHHQEGQKDKGHHQEGQKDNDHHHHHQGSTLIGLSNQDLYHSKITKDNPLNLKVDNLMRSMIQGRLRRGLNSFKRAQTFQEVPSNSMADLTLSKLAATIQGNEDLSSLP
jgi:hypothetical protein